MRKWTHFLLSFAHDNVPATVMNVMEFHNQRRVMGN